MLIQSERVIQYAGDSIEIQSDAGGSYITVKFKVETPVELIPLTFIGKRDFSSMLVGHAFLFVAIPCRCFRGVQI